jgi:hypothetical protein
MGKMKEITSDDSSLTCAPIGFDIIHAKGNTEPGFCLVVSLFLDLSTIFAIFFYVLALIYRLIGWYMCVCRHVCTADSNGMTGQSNADWSVVSIFAERVSRLQRVAKPHPLEGKTTYAKEERFLSSLYPTHDDASFLEFFIKHEADNKIM